MCKRSLNHQYQSCGVNDLFHVCKISLCKDRDMPGLDPGVPKSVGAGGGVSKGGGQLLLKGHPGEEEERRRRAGEEWGSEKRGICT